MFSQRRWPSALPEINRPGRGKAATSPDRSLRLVEVDHGRARLSRPYVTRCVGTTVTKNIPPSLSLVWSGPARRGQASTCSRACQSFFPSASPRPHCLGVRGGEESDFPRSGRSRFVMIAHHLDRFAGRGRQSASVRFPSVAGIPLATAVSCRPVKGDRWIASLATTLVTAFLSRCHRR